MEITLKRDFKVIITHSNWQGKKYYFYRYFKNGKRVESLELSKLITGKNFLKRIYNRNKNALPPF
jgi:hypothetical protein